MKIMTLIIQMNALLNVFPHLVSYSKSRFFSRNQTCQSTYVTKKNLISLTFFFDSTAVKNSPHFYWTLNSAVQL